MHGLHRIEASLGIQPLAQRPRNGFPHSLQRLRGMHGLRQSLFRPPLDGARHQTVCTVLRAIPTPRMCDMQQDAGEEEIPCCAMGLGIMDQKFPQLVPTMHQVSHLYKLQDAQTLRGFRTSIQCVYTVQCQEALLSMRRASRARTVWRQSVASFWEEIPELDIALYSVPHMHHVRC